MMIPEAPLIHRVRNAIERHAMIRPGGGTVLAAVSGGADSMALLYALRALGIPLEVAHFDHQTRAGESAADADFVRQTAENLGLPFHVASQPITEEAAALRLSFEHHARNARYDFLVRVARGRGCGVIATGHHADDRAETVLMRLLRGTGPTGLAGIPPVREEQGLRIVRPLFDCTRPEIEQWLRERGTPWREDKTNADPVHPRNRIRHELIPLLETEYNPRVRGALLRLAEMQRTENDLLDALAVNALLACRNADGAMDRAAFRGLHEALQWRCLLRLAHEQGIDPSFERLAEASRFIVGAATGQRFDFGGGFSLYNGRTHTRLIGREEDPGTGSAPHWRFQAKPKAMGVRFHLARSRPPRPEAGWRRRTAIRGGRSSMRTASAKSSKCARGGKATDSRPSALTGSKKLHDYFVDIGLPVPERHRVPLLVSKERIFWIVGHAVAAEAAVQPDTRRILELEVTPCV